jgi:hypothetical protein
MRKAARFLIFAVFALLIGVYFLNTRAVANAQVNNAYSAPVNNADVPQNLHTYSQNVMIEVMASLICQLSGVDPIQTDHKCLGPDPISKRIGYETDGAEGGAIGTMGNLIGYIYQLPLSSGDYFHYLATNFGATKKTYGKTIDEATTTTKGGSSYTGFEGLKPLLQIWVSIRDLVYSLFVLGFVIVGVAIMLRIKIDPRTVMTLQNRIPKIIAALLLVTFSYAIAGFLIDFMWTTIYLVINLFAQADPNMQLKIKDFYNLQGGNVFNYARGAVGVSDVAWDSSRGVVDVLGSALDNTAGRSITGLFLGAIGLTTGGLAIKGLNLITSLTGPVGMMIKGLTGVIAAGAAAGLSDLAVPFFARLVVWLVILIAVFSALFRLWFKLLIAFVMLVLGVVLAPLWIFAGILPGNKLGFGSWIRHMLSQIIIFPMTVAMFCLGKVVIDGYQAVGAGGQGFVPPLLGYGTDQASISSLLALGLVLITPNVAKWAGEIFKGPKLDATPIGQALKAGTGSLTEGAKTIAAYEHTPKGFGEKQQMTGVWSRFFR